MPAPTTMWPSRFASPNWWPASALGYASASTTRRIWSPPRRLAEADGGRLELTAQHPATFTLSLLAVRR
ncbi:hypothetical protein [Ilumatobacter sp.]|uniref:hypothetical protein n=1 Tax=Ilumatobacter sp. TaxID=1967498 RepID=UPI002A2E0DE7|nr:hypothetical protein [Ilumatobacter sp.]